jgi:predicted HicB family RNase H-like nuclease
MGVGQGYLSKKIAAGILDSGIEIFGGLLGSYFGLMLAALMTAMDPNAAPEALRGSMFSGLGFGFAFWAVAISFLNRVLIQGISRASIGKKVFGLELISTGNPITWQTIIRRWVLSIGSYAVFGAGYFYVLFDEEQRTFHDRVLELDIVPQFKGASMQVEYREEVRSMDEIRQMMILSNVETERQMAKVIQLPVKTKADPKKKSA